MSKVYQGKGKGWIDTETGQKVVFTKPAEAPADSMEAMKTVGTQQRNQNLERHLPTGWIHANYGVPSEGDGDKMRFKLCRLLKSHGLQTTDSRRLKSRGGSSYVGPINPTMDAQLEKLVKEFEKKFGAADLVTIYHGTYDQATAAMFADRTTRNAIFDLNEAEKSVIELEKALLGETKILNAEGKPVKLETTGPGRIASARRATDEVDTVIARFADCGLDAEVEKIRVRAAQVRAWTEKVATGFDKFASHERARKKADGNQEVA